MKELIWKQEKEQLEKCLQVIRDNIELYEREWKAQKAETKKMYDMYHSGNPELHNELVIGLDRQEQLERTLEKNKRAEKKPYFGRIDYQEKETSQDFSFYIGKNGIMKDTSEVLIVDWRAPISSVYYDSEIGECSYSSPKEEKIEISLNLKRTFEIENSELIDFYDTDVVSNDEFLTKYLAKNKEVILGEIIATIQKEQNQIIRDTPWHNVIVQGVAGSGKTTVAMHRISYILYNFKEKFHSDEFYIIGSNKMLLNYITGVLPNLDVHHINQMTLEEYFIKLLDQDFNPKKLGFQITSTFLKILSKEDAQKGKTEIRLKQWKGSLSFIEELENFLVEYTKSCFSLESIYYREELLYSTESIEVFLNDFLEIPLQKKVDMLNSRLLNKVNNRLEQSEEKKEVKQAVKNKYRNYFGKKNKKQNLLELYLKFILNGKEILQERHGKETDLEKAKWELLYQKIMKKEIDVYDLCALVYIKKRIKDTIDFDYVKHIVIDEAQDFGISVFYTLKRLFSECTFTIMGDISQNIYYDTGMNDWEELKSKVFHSEKDRFYILSKSYRNTVEISQYASQVLKKCSFRTYEIEPIIRHGKKVQIFKEASEQELVVQTVRLIQEAEEAKYDTIAVICRTIEETEQVRRRLKEYIDIEEEEEEIECMKFTNGVMVLPIHMTKGLEFDVVMLWNPDEINYQNTDADAKLLYVAITRALHELYLIYKGTLSNLLL